MRLNARLKLGFYPLAQAEAQRIRRFLSYAEGPSSVLDPCTGEAAAFQAMTAESGARRYGIELDAFRAADACRVLDEVIQGNAFDCHAPVESFSLLYLNPPYDFEVGEGKNQRMEKLFLEHCFRWLKPGGVLVMVVPFDRIQDCRAVLTPHFRDKAIYRLTEPEGMKYRQAVLFGVRRTRQERDRLTDAAIHHAHLKLADLTRSYDSIPALPDQPDREFAVPPSPPARLQNRGLPLDLIEDLLPNSPASLQARRITHADKVEFQGRPLTPLHKGHVGLLCTSGLLNGVFGDGEDRHVAFWEAVKVTDKTEEEGDGGETVIREKERFSQRLTLLYATGRFLMLSEKSSGKEGNDGERAPEAGQGDVCPANEG